MREMFGIFCIIAGILVLVLNKRTAETGREWAQLVGGPFTGPWLVPFQRIVAIVGGIGLIRFGSLLVLRIIK